MLDKLITKVHSADELKALYLETLLNHTSKVSKISDFSVLSAHGFGVGKLFQKDMKDTAVLESLLFPELSSGNYLDDAASLVGGLPRLTATTSSTFVLVYAEPGTLYIPGESYFASNQGVNFNIVDPIVIGESGYNYVPVRSVDVGVNTNVDPLTIISMSSAPIGHISCANEYAASGGRDDENDEDFKSRLLSFRQYTAKSVKDSLLAYLQAYNDTIIDVWKVGYDEDGKTRLMIVTCNGQWFTSEELTALEQLLESYLSLSMVSKQGSISGIKLINTTWHQVGGTNGVDFRVELSSSFTEIEVRKNIQIQLTKYFDFRYWDSNKIEWDDLLSIVKNVQGVKYVPDEYFNPNDDTQIGEGELPRVIKFIMRDMDGVILYNGSAKVLPIYYPVK